MESSRRSLWISTFPPRMCGRWMLVRPFNYIAKIIQSVRRMRGWVARGQEFRLLKPQEDPRQAWDSKLQPPEVRIGIGPSGTLVPDEVIPLLAVISGSSNDHNQGVGIILIKTGKGNEAPGLPDYIPVTLHCKLEKFPNSKTKSCQTETPV